jgi:hypothetical protein
VVLFAQSDKRAGERVRADPDAAGIVFERARAESPVIVDHIERCQELLTQISAYREDQSLPLAESGVSLLRHAAQLQDLLEPPPDVQSSSPAGRVVLVSTPRVVVFECRQIAEALSAGFEDVWQVVAGKDSPGAVIVSNRYASPA